MYLQTKTYRLSTVRMAFYGLLMLAFFGMIGFIINEMIVCNSLLMRLWLIFCLVLTYLLYARSNLRNFCWQVSISDTGLQARTLAGIRTIHWSRIARIARVSLDTLKLYVVETPEADLVILAAMDKKSELFQIIKDNLPSSVPPATTFTYYDPTMATYAAVLVTIIASVFTIFGLLGILWRSSKELETIIISTILSLVGVCVLSCWARTAKKVNVTSTGITIITWYGFQHQILYSQIKSLRSTSKPLPTGFLLNSQFGWFFFSSQLKGLDELQDLIRSRMSIKQPDALESGKVDVRLLGADSENDGLVVKIRKPQNQEEHRS